MYDAMKPHCLPCPYKPPMPREQADGVEEPMGEAKDRALKEMFEQLEENHRAMARQYFMHL